MQAFFGTGTALVTPFKSDNTIDFDALEELINFQIDNGVEYLVALGTTGETTTLSSEEMALVRQKFIEVNKGRLPMVLGIGGNNTANIVAELQNTDLSAFDAVLSVSPYYNKPTQEGIYQHFIEVANASPIPVIIYNVPSRTGTSIAPETVARLANSSENILGIKEAAGDMLQAMKMIQLVPDTFLVLSGDDEIALPMVLAGGAGVISVIGQAYPKEFSEMIRLGLEGKNKEAYNLQYKLLDVISLIFEEGNPVGIKALLPILEVYENDPTVRLPLVKATPSLQQRMRQFAKEFSS
jgi:4-hydroxy-tetrahydrodipicolinate synthase